MTRALVAIGGRHIRSGRVMGWTSGAAGVPEPYVEAIRRAGGREAILAPEPLDETGAGDVLRRFDALLLTGGGDIEPSLYGEERTDRIYGVDEERDAFELSLVRAAAKADVPVLAICRGAQVMNVAFGGTLQQDLAGASDGVDHGDPKEGDHRTHDVRLEAGSRVAKAMGVERAACESHHHQAVAKLGDGLLATGWADDGIVEAIEHEDGWLVGVQWHPEVSCATDPVQQRLFAGLVSRASRR